MPDRRMGPCSRFIGGWVNLLAYTYDQIAPFWQTPREVEWAKAAADGLADAWEPLPCPACGHTENAHGDGSGKGCYFCGCDETSAPTPGAVDGPAEGEPPEPSAVVEANVLGVLPWSFADGADDWWLKGAFPGLVLDAWGVVIGRFDTVAQAEFVAAAVNPSAEVEPPASVPAAECSAPEFDWVTTAIPVIAGVLAEHRPTSAGRFERAVFCGTTDEFCGEFADWADWRAHVAPHIAIAIQSDFLSTIYKDTTFAINAFSGDRPRPLADFPKHKHPRM